MQKNLNSLKELILLIALAIKIKISASESASATTHVASFFQESSNHSDFIVGAALRKCSSNVPLGKTILCSTITNYYYDYYDMYWDYYSKFFQQNDQYLLYRSFCTANTNKSEYYVVGQYAPNNEYAIDIYAPQNLICALGLSYTSCPSSLTSDNFITIMGEMIVCLLNNNIYAFCLCNLPIPGSSFANTVSSFDKTMATWFLCSVSNNAYDICSNYIFRYRSSLYNLPSYNSWNHQQILSGIPGIPDKYFFNYSSFLYVSKFSKENLLSKTILCSLSDNAYSFCKGASQVTPEDGASAGAKDRNLDSYSSILCNLSNYRLNCEGCCTQNSTKLVEPAVLKAKDFNILIGQIILCALTYGGYDFCFINSKTEIFTTASSLQINVAKYFLCSLQFNIDFCNSFFTQTAIAHANTANASIVNASTIAATTNDITSIARTTIASKTASATSQVASFFQESSNHSDFIVGAALRKCSSNVPLGKTILCSTITNYYYDYYDMYWDYYSKFFQQNDQYLLYRSFCTANTNKSEYYVVGQYAPNNEYAIDIYAPQNLICALGLSYTSCPSSLTSDNFITIMGEMIVCLLNNNIYAFCLCNLPIPGSSFANTVSSFDKTMATWFLCSVSNNAYDICSNYIFRYRSSLYNLPSYNSWNHQQILSGIPGIPDKYFFNYSSFLYVSKFSKENLLSKTILCSLSDNAYSFCKGASQVTPEDGASAGAKDRNLDSYSSILCNLSNYRLNCEGCCTQNSTKLVEPAVLKAKDFNILIGQIILCALTYGGYDFCFINSKTEIFTTASSLQINVAKYFLCSLQFNIDFCNSFFTQTAIAHANTANASIVNASTIAATTNDITSIARTTIASKPTFASPTVSSTVALTFTAFTASIFTFIFNFVLKIFLSPLNY